MVEIVTKSGVALDLDPECEFQIEMNNPMFEDDRIPVPYSTAITFLPTTKNKDIFGYLEAMLLAPTVNEIDVSIFVGGMPLLDGSLNYIGIEDGKLNYTFTEKSIESPSWDEPIYKLNLAIDFGQRLLIQEFANYLTESAANGGMIAAPFLIPQSKVAGNAYATSDLWNWFTSTLLYNFLPAVNVKHIIAAFAPELVSSPTSLCSTMNLWLLCRGLQYGSISYIERVDLNPLLPDITCKDLLIGILKIHSAFIFRDGDSLSTITAKEIFTSISPTDWDAKISDVYSMDILEREGYKLSFEADGSSGNDDPERYADMAISYDFVTMISLFSQVSNYITRKHVYVGAVYSGKGGTSNTQADMLFSAREPEISGPSDSVHEVSVPFKSVRSVPLKRGSAPTGRNQFMAPIIEANCNERPGKVVVGAMLNNQLVEHGRTIKAASNNTYSEAYSESGDLSISTLSDSYHSEIAEWYAKPRQIIKAEVSLSFDDIRNFRLYRPVSIRSRRFIVKSLRLSMRADSDFILSEADLVSL